MRVPPPSKDHFIDKAIPGRSDLIITHWVASGANAHLFRAYSKSLDRDLACKVIPRTNLLYGPDDSEIWRAEVQKANRLRNSTVVKFESDVLDWRDDNTGIDCVVLISDFVEGPSLQKFVKQHPDVIDIPFICHWLKTMLNLLYEMELRQVQHGDLHDGNILVEDSTPYSAMDRDLFFVLQISALQRHQPKLISKMTIPNLQFCLISFSGTSIIHRVAQRINIFSKFFGSISLLVI
jgi:serine/threonine protein kinase